MLKLLFLFIIFLFLTILQQTDGFQSFGTRIPNGLKVPHPCKPNSLWYGVGHLSQTGGGKRNPFGQDFRANGYKWTTALCKADSDKDGKTNGEELGDPDCLWKESMPDPPAPQGGIRHPGVCEPVDSDKCSFQTWVSCTGMKEKCPGMNETGVRTMDIRFPRTNLPPRETTYFCHIFKLPSDQDYHIVGTQPLVDNPMVIHHMILSGCNQDMRHVKESYNCIMGNAKCQEPLGGWTVGAEGECFPEAAGMPFGKNSSQWVQLQVHWTNEKKRKDIFDGSGMRIYYTSKLRKYDLGVMASGQMHLEIPPNTKGVGASDGIPSLQTCIVVKLCQTPENRIHVVQNGVCPSDCTRELLGKPVNITATSVHAHFLGKNLSVAQYRNGQFIRWLAKDDVYSYNNPITTNYNPPVQLRPGDELRTTCVFDSTGKKTWTYYGDGTFEEMCFGFFYYYPKLKDPMKQARCLSFERYTFCDFAKGNVSLHRHNFGSCNLKEFDSSPYLQNVLRACPYDAKTCSPGCKFYLHQMDSHRCMKGMIRKMWDGALYRKSNITAVTLFKARSLCEFVKLQPSGSSQRRESFLIIVGAITLSLLRLVK